MSVTLGWVLGIMMAMVGVQTGTNRARHLDSIPVHVQRRSSAMKKCVCLQPPTSNVVKYNFPMACGSEGQGVEVHFWSLEP